LTSCCASRLEGLPTSASGWPSPPPSSADPQHTAAWRCCSPTPCTAQGPTPRDTAHGFPELHVLLETDGEHDAPLAADIARLGRGRLARIRTHRDAAAALNRLLSTR